MPIQISCVVLSYNGGDSLIRTLESCKLQTYPYKDLVIADDASTDNGYTVSVIEKWLADNSKFFTDVLFIKNETNMGKRIAKRKEEKEIEKENRAYLNRIKVAEQEHQLRLSELREQVRERREDAEAQFFMAHSEAKMKTYLQDCWPLRNPFDAPLAIEPIYNEASKRLQGCRLKTILTKNSQEIVPLRFISAHLDTSHPIASTINSELSIFLVEHYKTNGEHGVISEIGAWKNSIPVNDASITYLFQGMQGQPVMVLVPEYINNGATVRFKIYSWGLGEKLTYPVGFDFGSLDLEALYNRVVASENTKMCAILSNTSLFIY